MKQKKTFYFTDNRFKFIALILFIMFIIFMVVIFLKADEVTRDPCSICAERMGEEVNCYVGNLQRTYYLNETIFNKRIG